ncbi:MAG TPA: hypothetical protein VKG25_06715 [Bryobacteraceae bacterium]|nr:hypothetical protein [Bryobacteraceae bacterium]
MFFRREKPKVVSFSEHTDNLKALRFAVESLGAGKVKVSRDGIAAVIEDVPGKLPRVNKAGLAIGGEIGLIENHGYQMFWRTPGGKRIPATAVHLKALHAFQEDLKYGLGLTSLYNESLGTVSDLHLYDRVEHRDDGHANKPWQHH